MTGRIGKLQRFCPTHTTSKIGRIWQKTQPSFSGTKVVPYLVAVVATVAPIEVASADS